MPGLPPNPLHYQVGGVIISLGGLDLGNVAGFGIDPSDIEVLEHFSSRSGARKLDRQVIVQKKLSFTCTLDEHQKNLYAKYFMGATATSERVLALTNPLAESAVFIRYLNESGNIWTFSHTRCVARPNAAMDFGDFSDWVAFGLELEMLEDLTAPVIDGVVPSFGAFTFVQ